MPVYVTARAHSWDISWKRVVGAVRYKVTRASRPGVTSASVSTARTRFSWDSRVSQSVNPVTRIVYNQYIESRFTVQAYGRGGRLLAVGSDTACPVLEIVSVRGSGENENLGKYAQYSIGDRGLQVWIRLSHALAGTDKDRNGLGASFVGAQPVPYPAISVQRAIEGSLFSEYQKSERAGIKALDKVMRRDALACPTTKIVLVGYSQGAQVAGDWYQSRPSQFARVAHVVLVADAGRSNADRPVDYPTNTRNSKDNAFVGVMGNRPAFTATEAPRVNSWCWLGDFVCQSTVSNAGQFHGTKDGRDPYTECLQGWITYHLVNGLVAHRVWRSPVVNPVPGRYAAWCDRAKP
jgi:pimeloyl-ACP methyl ester carboxylesterase